MFNNLFIILIISLLSTGCGHPNFFLVKPPVVDEDNRVLIMVYRDGKRPGTRHWIGLNGSLIAGLNEREYTEFYVAVDTNLIFTMCTLPTHDLDKLIASMTGQQTYGFDKLIDFMDLDDDRIYKVDPIVSKDLNPCYLSFENESIFGNNCSFIKLKRQKNAVCDEKREQLSFVKPGPIESSQ